MINQITVVILSRGREEILKNTLNFWGRKEIPVLVLHNSEKPLKESEIPTNVEYVVENTSFGQRCGEVPRYLKTKYAILSADDEMYILSALAKILQTFEIDTDLVSVGGSVLAIGRYGPRITGTNCYKNINGYENLESSGQERLLRHFDIEEPWRGGAMYRVIKSEIFCEMMTLFKEISICSTPYIYEVSGEILINSSGKTKYLNEIYWIRNWINDPIGHKDWNRAKYFSSWFTNPENQNEVFNWKILIRLSLGMDSEQLEKVLQRVFTLRLESESNEIKRNKKQKWPVSDSFKHFVRIATRSRAMPKDYLQTLNEMEQQGIHSSLQETKEAIFNLAFSNGDRA